MVIIIKSAGFDNMKFARQAPALKMNLLPSSSPFYPEDTGSRFLWNAGAYLPSYTTQCSTRPTTF
jgi:hypothetical protein